MQRQNGKGLKPRYVEILCDSGVRLWVTPLNRYQLKALYEKVDGLFPMPDKKQYEQEVSEDISIVGTVIPGDQNPEYRKEAGRIVGLRQEYIINAMRDLCVTFPDYPGIEGRINLVNEFQDYIEQQRELFNDGDNLRVPMNAWEATWKFAILRSPEDETQLDKVVRDELPITEVEVTDAMRLFRPALSREKLRGLDAVRKLAPRLDSTFQD